MYERAVQGCTVVCLVTFHFRLFALFFFTWEVSSISTINRWPGIETCTTPRVGRYNSELKPLYMKHPSHTHRLVLHILCA